MNLLSQKNQSGRFFFGTLISSVGSMTFNVALMAFMIKAGYSLFQVSLIIGLQRLLPICLSFFLGDWTDRIAPRKVVIATELGAAIGTLGILWSWSLGKSGYPLLVTFCLIKAAGLQFQSGSRVLISKLLSAAEYSSNARNAMWLNQATQGATLFAGAIAFFLVSYGTLDWAIWFDFLTFVLNGALLLSINVGRTPPAAIAAAAGSLLQKFRNLYRFNPRTAGLDAMLAIAMCGAASFRTRAAGSAQEWNAIFLLSYGISVWVSSWIERSGRLREYSSSIWLALGSAFLMLGFFPEAGWLTFSLFLVRDTAYWLLLHRISAFIQTDTPAAITGSVASARNFQMISILSSGELLVGAWQGVLPMAAEGLWRSALCLGVGTYVLFTKLQPELGHERPQI